MSYKKNETGNIIQENVMKIMLSHLLEVQNAEIVIRHVSREFRKSKKLKSQGRLLYTE